MKRSMERTHAIAASGLLILMISAIWQQSGALPSSANMSYAMLLGMTLLLSSVFAGRPRSAEWASRPAFAAQSSIPETRFEDVAANDEAMDSLRELVAFLRSPEKYRRMGARIPRGVLLYGLPGTGKTLMARALAGEAGVPFFAVNGADFVEMYVGVGASRVRTLFQKARKAGRAVIFFDEIDAVGKKRDNRSDEREQTLNALLSEMSGFFEHDGIVVVAATNRVDTLDEALLRPGRFDRQIEVPLPTQEQRLQILQVHAKKKLISQEISLADIARRTVLFSGAKLETLMNEAALCAVKRGAERIEPADLFLALDTVLLGAQRRDLQRLEHERRITAAHEAAHAIATAVLLPGHELQKVSIIPTTRGAAGYSLSLPVEKLFHEKQELLCHIAVALAGREGERLLLGRDRVGTGASNDIEKAALMARRMVCEWGMLPESDEAYLFSQQQKDAACQQWLHRGQQLAAQVLNDRHDAWLRLQEKLLRDESATGTDVMECLEM